jgi:asparagine synthase (glutamine-hydrolysing)
MCGIAGIIINNQFKDNNLENLISRMTQKLSHRGPDHNATWCNEKKNLFIGHARLSILDISKNGNQPMHSSSGRYVLSYNGEVYNHNNIRHDIEKNKTINWKSTSDTETILEAIELWGVKNTIEKLSGMFALSLYDKNLNKVFLARDKNGEKPLYYGFHKSSIVFASELKSFLSINNFSKDINKNSLSYFFKYSYIPEPNSIFNNIFKLKPGCILEINLNNFYIIENVKEIEKYTKYYNFFFDKKYFQFEDIRKHFYNSDKESNLDSILNKAVTSAMISDVNIGSFLSGGTDSSLITAIMQKNSKKKIKTFSVIFKEKKYNEEYYSNQVSRFLKTDHYELSLNYKDIIDQIKFLPDIFDEPFADSSQIPTILLSKFARDHIKVALTGDGCDEFFGGYNRYILFGKINKIIKLVPNFLRQRLGGLLFSIPFKYINFLEGIIFNRIKNFSNISQLDNKIKKLSLILLNCKTEVEIYLSLIKVFQYNENLVLDNKIFSDEIDDYARKIFLKKELCDEESMMNVDQKFYLSGDILHKVDRGAMYSSLETRMPFLNPSVTFFSSLLTLKNKIHKNEGKIIIKNIIKKYLPKDLINPTKMGFSIPIDEWIRGPLKDWSKDILDAAKKNYLIDSKLIARYEEEHFSGTHNWGQIIWNIIVFQKWYQKNCN